MTHHFYPTSCSLSVYCGQMWGACDVRLKMLFVMFQTVLLINRQHLFCSAEEDMEKEPSCTSCMSSIFLSCSLLPSCGKHNDYSKTQTL